MIGYVPLDSPLNVYVLLVCAAVHVFPLSLLNQYLLIPDSLSVPLAFTVMLFLVVLYVKLAAVGAVVSIVVILFVVPVYVFFPSVTLQ